MYLPKTDYVIFIQLQIETLQAVTGTELHCIVTRFMDHFICLVYTVFRGSAPCYERETIRETRQVLLMYVYGVQKLLPFRSHPPRHVSFGETLSTAYSEAILHRFILVLWYHAGVGSRQMGMYVSLFFAFTPDTPLPPTQKSTPNKHFPQSSTSTSKQHLYQ